MIKTLVEYQQLASRTCPDLGSDKLNLAHMVMGMCSELSELEDATEDINRAEELADVLWYVANYATLRGIVLPNELLLSGVDKNLAWYIHELTDKVKKFVAYNKLIVEIDETFLINSIITSVYDIMYNFSISTMKALTNNINKLRIRYPEKFSDDLAINRNLVEERKQLEK